jgi:hypothetical protein
VDGVTDVPACRNPMVSQNRLTPLLTLRTTFHAMNDVSCKEKVVKVTGIGPRTILYFDSDGLK